MRHDWYTTDGRSTLSAENLFIVTGAGLVQYPVLFSYTAVTYANKQFYFLPKMILSIRLMFTGS